MAAKRASGVGRSRVADPTCDSTSRAKARASPRRHSSSGVSVKSIGTALLPTQSQKDSVFDCSATSLMPSVMLYLPLASMCPTIQMNSLAFHKVSGFEIEQQVCNFNNLGQPLHRTELF